MRTIGIPRGFRDFPPEIMIVRLNVVEKIRKIFELYGFPPMDTPAIEHWETLSGKYGDEAEKLLIWRFKDPFSDRMYALRYDLTVPLARYVSMHPELPLPFKRHQISLVWRHEEPQKRRYREFLQADIDTVGSPYPEADAEIISAVQHALKNLGLGDIVVRLNHRVLLKKLFEKHLMIENPIPIYRAIDKLDKIGESGVKNELEKTGLEKTKIEKIMKLISLRGEPEKIIEEYMKEIGKKDNVAEELEYIYTHSLEPEKIVIDISMVRGLDYYTGPIMEFNLEKEGGPSLAGGGRYDELIGLFRQQGSIPATGCSIGVERVIDVLLEKGIFKKKKTTTKAMIIYIDKKHYDKAWNLAMILRNNGIPTEIDIMRRTPAKQKKRLQTTDIKYIVYIGEQEIKTEKYTLYDREKETRKQLTLKELINEINK